MIEKKIRFIAHVLDQKDYIGVGNLAAMVHFYDAISRADSERVKEVVANLDMLTSGRTYNQGYTLNPKCVTEWIKDGCPPISDSTFKEWIELEKFEDRYNNFA